MTDSSSEYNGLAGPSILIAINTNIYSRPTSDQHYQKHKSTVSQSCLISKVFYIPYIRSSCQHLVLTKPQKQRQHHLHHHQQHFTIIILKITPSLPHYLPYIHKGNGYCGDRVLVPISINSGESTPGGRG